MSSDGETETATFELSGDTVTVTKQFVEDEYPVPAIVFSLSNETTEETFIELRDPVGHVETDFDEDDEDLLGFHPSYHEDHWTKTDTSLFFSYKLAADETIETLYGIRETDPFLDDVLVEPELTNEQGTPPDGYPENIPISVDTSPADATETSDKPSREESTEEDSPTDEIRNTDATEADSMSPSDEGTDDPDEHETVPEESADSAESARNDESTQSSSGSEQSTALETRITQLETDTAKLRAYTTALEELLDESGTTDDIMETVADLQQTLGAHETRLEELESDIESVPGQETISVLEADVEAVRAEVAELVEWRDTLQNTLLQAGQDNK